MKEKEKILIVDDDPLVGAVIAGLLKNRGYKTNISTSGEEAIQAAAAFKFDLIIMDIQMPDMSGVEAGQHISTNGRIPILYLTADKSDEVMHDAIKKGGFGYLLKPIQSEQLIPAVLSCMRRGKEVTLLNASINNVSEVSRAIGILMERHSLSGSEASHALKRMSRKSNRKMVEIAKVIVDESEEIYKKIRESRYFLD